MKIRLVFFIFMCIIALLIIFINGKMKMDEISYSKLVNDVKIIGALGMPLGEIIKIEGTAVTENSKKYSGSILLKVIKVNDKKLSNPVVIPYSTFSFISIKELKENDAFKFTGYETGSMDGIPEDAFKIIPYAATENYGFNVYFQVCGEER